MTDLLLKRFPTQDLNCNSPIALGRHCMAIAWKKDGIFVPPAPPEILELLKISSPQGRHEILTLPDLETIPALYEYDLRLAYLWCCKRLPYGDLMRTGGSFPDGHKMCCRWEAPMDWGHIGLLPQKCAEWSYPVSGCGWIDRREYEMADHRGWDIRVLGDGLLWLHEGALDRWSDGIQWALRQVEEGSLVYQMLRRVALWTIGSLHRTSSIEKMSSQAPPIDIVPNARYEPEIGEYSWTEEVPIKGSEKIYVHPEWTTTIWARCRARIASFALQVPREQLIAIRQDALYTSVRQFQFEGRHRVPIGGIRLKWMREEEAPAPHTLEDLDRLRRGQ